jgi:hypothetical protein
VNQPPLVSRWIAGLLLVALPFATAAVNVGAGTGWAIVPTPNPTVPIGSLAAISCPTDIACTAVGSFNVGPGDSAPFAEVRAPAGWSLQHVPAPAGSINAFLNGVSCLTATFCVTVGYFNNGAGGQSPLAEHWNGTGWSIQPTPGAPGANLTQLWGVSCVSTSFCAAVGNFSSSSGPQTLAEAWNGQSWSVQATPNPTTDAHLSGVACTSAKNCVAVGTSTDHFTGSIHTLSMRWGGKFWTILAMPNVPGVAELSGISCLGAKSCMAVGFQNSGSATGGVPLTLAEHWNGTSWRVQQTANPTSPFGAFLDSVSCGVGACTAAGYYEPSSGAAPILTLVESWNGKSWSIRPTPNPPNTINALLLGISCPSQQSCVAAGYYAVQGMGPAGSPDFTLAEGVSGGSWSIQPTPNPMGSLGAGLNGTSCLSASACEAVGFTADPAGNYVTLAEDWNGTQWAIQASPSPSSNSSVFSSVSCASATACVAVGNYVSGSVFQFFAESWNGTMWSMQPPITPSGAVDGHMTSIACVGTGQCTAVGYYSTTGNDELPLAESWNASAWTIQAMPSPAGSLTAQPFGVSCASASACLAVGINTDRSGSGTLVERWDGIAWTLLTAATPLGFTPGFSGVSCVSATACEAVGGFNPGTGYSQPFAEGWDGSTWTVQSMPSPNSSLPAVQRSISCTSSTACTAVGYYSDASLMNFTLAETWNGTSWSIVATPSPSSTTGALLNAVSCTSTCMAVGRGLGVTLAMSDH